MNSMIEYIRQINQTSVSLKSEWLERLRNVDAGPDAAVATPEIVLMAESSKAEKIPQYSEGNFEPPITMLPNEQESTVTSREDSPHSTADATPESAANDQASEPSGVHVVTTESVEQLGAQLYEQYSSELAGPGFITASAVQPVAPPVSRSEAEPETSPMKPRPADQKDNAIQSKPDEKQGSDESIHPSVSSVLPVPGQMSMQMLETPAVLDGILRPTIMPLRQKSGTDVFDTPVQRPSLPGDVTISNEAAAPAMKPVPAEQPAVSAAQPVETAAQPVDQLEPLTPLESFSATPPSSPATEPAASPEPLEAVETPEADPPSRIIEIIGGLEGTQGEEIYTNDTVLDLNNVRKQISWETGLPATDAPAEIPAVQPGQPEAVAAAENLQVTFPNDKRAERFHYEKTRKQKLVNSIVDQIADRFPTDSNATIMLIGASREIDTDSAASRIATCLATRDVGDILLVDANTRSRQLTALLGMESQKGIIDSFQKNGDANELVCPTDNPRLKVLGAGSRAGENESMPCANVTNNSLKKAFQYTIIGGGIAGDSLTDAWSAIVDGVYLIVDMDESDRNVVVETVEYFRKIGARIVGCIATRA